MVKCIVLGSISTSGIWVDPHLSSTRYACNTCVAFATGKQSDWGLFNNFRGWNTDLFSFGFYPKGWGSAMCKVWLFCHCFPAASSSERLAGLFDKNSGFKIRYPSGAFWAGAISQINLYLENAIIFCSLNIVILKCVSLLIVVKF